MKSKITILCLRKKSFHRRISTVCFYLHEIPESAKTNAWLLSFFRDSEQGFLEWKWGGQAVGGREVTEQWHEM